MTNEEAIAILEMFLHKQCSLSRTEFAYTQSEVWGAVDMATEALKREQAIIENGYTGREMQIRIGGRLFAVRELAQ